MAPNPVADPSDPPTPSVLLLVDVQRDFMDDGPVPVKGAYGIIPAINALLRWRGSFFDLAVATQDWHPPDHISFVTTHDPGWTEERERAARGAGRSGTSDGGSAEALARAKEATPGGPGHAPGGLGGEPADEVAKGSRTSSSPAPPQLHLAGPPSPSHRALRLGDTVTQPERLDPSGPAPTVWLFRPHCLAGSRGAGFADGLEASRIDAAFRKGEHASAESFSGFADLGRTRDSGLGAYLRGRGARALTVAGVATEYCVKATVLDALAEGLRVLVVLDGVRGVEETAADAALLEMAAAGARLVHVSPGEARLGSSGIEGALSDALR